MSVFSWLRNTSPETATREAKVRETELALQAERARFSDAIADVRRYNQSVQSGSRVMSDMAGLMKLVRMTGLNDGDDH